MREGAVTEWDFRLSDRTATSNMWPLFGADSNKPTVKNDWDSRGNLEYRPGI